MRLDERAHGSRLVDVCEELGKARPDGHGVRDPVAVAAAELEPLEPLVQLVGSQPAREHGHPQAPRRRLRRVLRADAVDSSISRTLSSSAAR